MVGADDAAHPAAAGEQRGHPVQADVGEGVQVALAVADHGDRLAGDLPGQIVAGLVQRRGAADAEPFAAEEARRARPRGRPARYRPRAAWRGLPRTGRPRPRATARPHRDRAGPSSHRLLAAPAQSGLCAGRGKCPRVQRAGGAGANRRLTLRREAPAAVRRRRRWRTGTRDGSASPRRRCAASATWSCACRRSSSTGRCRPRRRSRGRTTGGTASGCASASSRAGMRRCRNTSCSSSCSSTRSRAST